MAYTTFGTNDVLTFQQDLTKIQTRGPIALYREGVQAFSPTGKPFHRQVFIHPPFIIHVLQFWGLMASLFHVPLGFWVRFSCALADIGSLLLVWRLSQQVPALKIRAPALLILALAPVSIFISGFHGNTDPIMIFFALLSVYCIDTRRSLVLAGIFMGFAVSIKIIPVILIPAAFFYISRTKDRVQFVVISGAVFFLLGMPALLLNPGLILYKLITYGGSRAIWGVPMMGILFGRNFAIPELALIACIAAVSAAMNWPRPRLPLFAQSGLIISLFLFLTPGFGVQYLSWLVPWLSCLGVCAAAAYDFAGGLFLFALYTAWSGGLPWYYANALETHPVPLYGVYAEMACWLATGYILVRFAGLWLRGKPQQDQPAGRSALLAIARSEAVGTMAAR